jgi:signal transduction histidine kinase
MGESRAMSEPQQSMAGRAERADHPRPKPAPPGKSQAERQLDRRQRQQAAVARIGQAALENMDLAALVDAAVHAVAKGLEVEFAKLVEPIGDGRLFLRAGVGWHAGVVGHATVSAASGSQAGHALRAHGPVIVDDLRTETRFTPSPLFLDHGIVSGLSVLVGPREEPLGVLGAHSAEPRTFTSDDVNFLQAMANLLAAAIARRRVEEEVLRNHDELADDVQRRRSVEDLLERRNRQQAAVARLGVAALEGLDHHSLLDLAVREVAKALDVEHAKFVEVQPGSPLLLLRAGVGWKVGRVGHATVPSGPRSQAGYAIEAHGPVIVPDLRTETRFTAAPLFVEHGIVSGLSVLVGRRDEPDGVLGVHTTVRREFSQDDVNFVQAVANLLATAIARNRVETDLRRHRDDLELLVHERTRLLEASNRELEAFSYTVSHDLRTPLRAIDGFSQLLQIQHSGSLSPEAHTLIDRVREGTKRMGQLIESLLALARIGRADVTPVEVDLTELAESILEDLSSRHPDRQVAWTVEPDLSARGDLGLLRILLANLLGNAWKFTRGKAHGRIEVLRDPTTQAFVVRDNGAGFDVAHASRLFEPFQRLHTTSEFEGNGVGLATVQRIVQRHGGRVWAEAKPGHGATFRFTLPLAASAPHAPATPAAAMVPTAASAPLPAAAPSTATPSSPAAPTPTQ